MNPPALITRQDVAEMLNVSTDIVRKNESRLGIDKARHDINKRTIRYTRTHVVEILTSRGFLSTTTANFRK